MTILQGHPRTRLLYITPEYTLTETFRRNMQAIYAQGELARVAIDEAHCISEWGHDFRPAYAHLSYFRQAYPTVPIICLTATATPSVRASIMSNLSLNTSNLRTFLIPIARPNLHFEVRFTSDADSDTRFQWLLSWLREIYKRRATDAARTLELALTRTRTNAVSGIIYVAFRSDCDALASRLRANSIGAVPYHAGLPSQDRISCQKQWIANAPGHDIVVATTAFGMGIDKQDVRFVVHWSIPKSFEGYYQEAGRAGRDGKAAACIMFYSREERDRVAWRMSKDTKGGGGGGGDDSGRARGNINSNSKTNNTSTTDTTTAIREAQSRNRAASFARLVAYCEDTTTCRHASIRNFFNEGADPDPAPNPNPPAAAANNPPTSAAKDNNNKNKANGQNQFPDPPISICDFACDFCKDADDLTARKSVGLASEEWVSTQREEGLYGGVEDSGYGGYGYGYGNNRLGYERARMCLMPYVHDLCEQCGIGL